MPEPMLKPSSGLLLFLPGSHPDRIRGLWLVGLDLSSIWKCQTDVHLGVLQHRYGAYSISATQRKEWIHWSLESLKTCY